MSRSLDLALPSTYPRLGDYGRYSWSNSSFALYSLLDTNLKHFSSIAATLDAKKYAKQDFKGSHLVRIAPSPLHKSLSGVLDTHAALDKVVPGQSERQLGAMDLEWYPSAFVVVVGEVLDERGLCL